MLRHVPTRWLSLLPAAQRFSELFAVLKKYFLEYLPKKKIFKKTKQYDNIIYYFMHQFIELELLVVIETGIIFEEYMKKLQQSKPQIHRLYHDLISVISVLSDKIAEDLADNIESNHLNQNIKVNLSSNIENKIIALNLDQESKNEFLFYYANHYVAIAYDIVDSCNFKILKAFECLDPRRMNHQESSSDVEHLLAVFPKCHLDIDFTQNVRAEYSLLQADEIDLSKHNLDQIDVFWHTVLDEQKFENLRYFFLNLLCVSHGQADVERHFSISKNYLTEEKGFLKVRTLNAVLNTIDGIQHLGCALYDWPVPDELVQRAIRAKENSDKHLEAERTKRATEEELQIKANARELQERQVEEVIVAAKENLADLDEEITAKEVMINNEKQVIKAIISESNNHMNEIEVVRSILRLKELEQKKRSLELKILKRKRVEATSKISKLTMKKRKIS